MLSPLAQKVFPVSVESKNTRTRPGPGELKQAEANKYDGTVAAVCWKPPRKGYDETMVMMKVSDLCTLIKKVRNDEQGTDPGKEDHTTS